MEKSTWIKCISFHILHSCLKSDQTRGNNKKNMISISYISTSIGCFKNSKKWHSKFNNFFFDFEDMMRFSLLESAINYVKLTKNRILNFYSSFYIAYAWEENFQQQKPHNSIFKLEKVLKLLIYFQYKKNVTHLEKSTWAENVSLRVLHPCAQFQ